MALAYVDTSCLLAVLLKQELNAAQMERLKAHEQTCSANFLEAELRSALVRERVTEDPGFLTEIHWILPDRPLTAEIRAVLTHGYVKGADLWHLATALFFANDPSTLPFLTLDRRQGDVAAALGFPTPLQSGSL